MRNVIGMCAFTVVNVLKREHPPRFNHRLYLMAVSSRSTWRRDAATHYLRKIVGGHKRFEALHPIEVQRECAAMPSHTHARTPAHTTNTNTNTNKSNKHKQNKHKQQTQTQQTQQQTHQHTVTTTRRPPTSHSPLRRDVGVCVCVCVCVC